jgi:hypothetical protein
MAVTTEPGQLYSHVMQEKVVGLLNHVTMSRVESFHHVILSIAPKHLSFGFQAMYAR